MDLLQRARLARQISILESGFDERVGLVELELRPGSRRAGCKKVEGGRVVAEEVRVRPGGEVLEGLRDVFLRKRLEHLRRREVMESIRLYHAIVVSTSSERERERPGTHRQLSREGSDAAVREYGREDLRREAGTGGQDEARPRRVPGDDVAVQIEVAEEEGKLRGEGFARGRRDGRRRSRRLKRTVSVLRSGGSARRMRTHRKGARRRKLRGMTGVERRGGDEGRGGGEVAGGIVLRRRVRWVIRHTPFVFVGVRPGDRRCEELRRGNVVVLRACVVELRRRRRAKDGREVRRRVGNGCVVERCRAVMLVPLVEGTRSL
jgi:hypothetical protein